MGNNRDVRLKVPCKGCKYRSVSCHITCFLYKEWKTQTEVVNKLMRKDRDVEENIMGVKKARVRKRGPK